MKKILIVVDMQNDFIDKNVLGNDDCVAVVPNVIEKINSAEYKDAFIFATRDTHHDNYLETQEGKNLPVVHCVEGTKGWEIEENIKNALLKHGVTIINKPTFGSMELAEQVKQAVERFMKKEDCVEIELCGVCTGICVISNALLLKAALPEIKISVDSKCCACVTPESHVNALNAMKLCQINII